jgi:glycosyltransferase involved in cell wall biosynthesis
MVLQRILLPDALSDCAELYCRSGGAAGDPFGAICTGEEGALAFSPGQWVSFDTYFGVFALEKWRKYTAVFAPKLTLDFVGRFELVLTRLQLSEYVSAFVNSKPDSDREETPQTRAKNVKTHKLIRMELSADERQTVTVDYPDIPENEGGVLSFALRAIGGEARFYGGSYDSAEDGLPLPRQDVKIALCICTYRRESYVMNLLALLKKQVFDNQRSPVRDKLRVYIADNGGTLDRKIIESQAQVRLFVNKNSGGAGGFTRAMLEAGKDKERLQLTHYLLCDDDISLDIAALERTCAFLSLAKAPYINNLMLGGAMLRTDHPCIQQAAGEIWGVGGTLFTRAGYDLSELYYVLQNEQEESVNQLAWWYCAFPMDIVTGKHKGEFSAKKPGYALPLFFQYDDIDFNQRHSDLPKTTLSGVCLWHDAFEAKMSISKEYYALRNRLITCALHENNGSAERLSDGKRFNKRFVRGILWEETLKYIVTYRYAGAMLIRRAVLDFLKGPDFLINTDPEALNREIMSAGYLSLPTDKLPYTRSWYDNGKKYTESRIKRFFRFATGNGALLPAQNRYAVVDMAVPRKALLFRAKHAVFYNPAARVGYVTHRSNRAAAAAFFAAIGTAIKLNFGMKKAVRRYRQRYDYLIGEAFWRKYLGIK